VDSVVLNVEGYLLRHFSGGARISKDNSGNNGVVDHMGEIFQGNTENKHRGLIVCDGSAIPAAVGVNPFATITAFAERSVELVARDHGISVDLETKNGNYESGNPISFAFY
jgi:choline dehydrogenase-like flavoprotein